MAAGAAAAAGAWRRGMVGTRGHFGLRSRAFSGLSPRLAVRAEVVEVTNADDPRLAIYRVRPRRDHLAYQAQVRALAEAALQASSDEHSRDKNDDEARLQQRSTQLVPLKKLGCVVDVHYSWDCLRQLREALGAGCRVPVASALLPGGAAEELVALAAEVAPTVYVVEPNLFASEFAQDAPWNSRDGDSDHGVDVAQGRSPWRRFEGGAAQGTCRFAVAFPSSVPLRDLEPPFVVFDGLSSASNVGQVLRTAYHLGVTSVVASPEAWRCLNGRACRVSMGWLYRMRFHLADPLPASIAALQGFGVRVYAAENQFSSPVAPHKPLGDRRWALVMGSEGHGVSQEIVDLCDERICVPQQQGSSLNVAHACSICLYELSKHNVMQI